jgi:hypothetical protein
VDITKYFQSPLTPASKIKQALDTIEEDLRKENCNSKNTKDMCGGMCYDAGLRWHPKTFEPLR